MYVCLIQPFEAGLPESNKRLVYCDKNSGPQTHSQRRSAGAMRLFAELLWAFVLIASVTVGRHIRQASIVDDRRAPSPRLTTITVGGSVSETCGCRETIIIQNAYDQERPQDFGQGVNAALAPEAKKILKI